MSLKIATMEQKILTELLNKSMTLTTIMLDLFLDFQKPTKKRLKEIKELVAKINELAEGLP